MKVCAENIPLLVWYLWILIPNLAENLSNYTFPTKFSSWMVLWIRCTQVKLLKISIVTWAAQVHAIVNVPNNPGTNTGWYEWSWSTKTAYPSLLSVSLRMDPDFFHFVLNCCLLAVPNMHDSQRGTLYFRSKNCARRTPGFDSINIYLVCRGCNLSLQDLNVCCKGDSTSGNMML